MVWKDFRRHGYITAWSEDAANIGTFNYRMVGFKDQPTDHYMRIFYLEAEKQYKKHKKLCLGSKRRSRVLLDWVKDMYVMYKNRSKFVFGFVSATREGRRALALTA